MYKKLETIMSNEHADELNELLQEAEKIATYLTRQVKSGAINTILDKKNIERFVEALDVYKRVSKN